MKKITYIISNVNKAIAFEWIVDAINHEKFELSFILLNPGESELEKELLKRNISVTTVVYKSKKNLPGAWWKTYRILKKNKPDAIHCHLFEASLIGLLAGKFAGIKKRIHTRHHSSYHHVYFPNAVKHDKRINKWSTHVIAISKNVSEILVGREKCASGKVRIIHHGFKLGQFNEVNHDRVETLRKKYELTGAGPVIGVISRYTEWKGIQFTIAAFQKLLELHPEAVLILSNASGNYTHEIKRLLGKIPSKNYREIVFENDIFALYKLFTVFVHVPIDHHSEAFGQTYVEALAAGVPSVFTLSGVACEFIKDGENAMVVPYKNTEAIHEKMVYLINKPNFAQELAQKGKLKTLELFGLERMITSLERLYEE